MRRLVFLAALLATACGSQTEVKKAVPPPIVAVKNDANKAAPDKLPATRGKRKLNEAPNGDVATLVIPGNLVEIADKSKAKRTLDSDTLHPPPGEKGLIGIAAQTTTFLDDGTLLVGVGDGTLVALDAHDKPQWSIGFRGAVTGIVPANDDRVIVTTQRGVIASVQTKTGQVHWEKHLMSGALTPAIFGSDDHIYVAGPRGVLAFTEDGTLVFSHAITLADEICCYADSKDAFAIDASGHITGSGLDIRVSDPHPPIADAIPAYIVDYEKVLDEKVFSMLSAGPDELWLLLNTTKGSELARYSRGAMKRFAIPTRTANAESMSLDEKPQKLPLEIDDIFLGPQGNPWIVGRKIFPPAQGEAPWYNRPAKGIVLELNGTTARERKDLGDTLDEHLVTTSNDSRIRGPEIGNLRLLCFGEETVCALYDGSKPEIIPRKVKTTGVFVVGKNTYVVSNHGPVEKLEGHRLVPIPSPKDARYSISAVGGTSEDDLWFTTLGHVAYHWDGKTFTATSVPQSIESGVIARTRTDVWSRNGLLHWDGKRWSLVADAQGAAGMVVRGPNDVWVGNRNGLFHSKPSTRTLVRWPEVKSADTKPLETPKTLTLGAPSRGYLASKTSLAIKNAPSVSTAKRVEVARDGTLWFEAWDRLVEVDTEGKTTILDKEEKRIAFERWFYPEGPGRGIFTHRARESESYNDRDEIRRFDGGKSGPSTVRLDGHDIVAMSGNAAGATWILGSVEAGSQYQLQKPHAEELGIHALVRADEKSAFQIVAGMPALAYRDVAVTPEGGGFFVGAQNAGPMGEGVIVHARGRLGTESVTRYRAPATMLAVAAVSNDEAWAVGAMGLIVHIKGQVIERHVLPSGSWLRAVIATAPHDIWVAGDDGTLLHGDGKEFHPVNHPLGARAAFSGLAVSRGIVWAASPSGILRIVNTGTTAPM